MGTLSGHGTHSTGNGNGSTQENRGEVETREGPFEARRGESRAMRDREPGRGMRRWKRGSSRARDIMTRNPKTARPTDTVQAVAQIMVDEDCGIVPVCDESGRLLGVITDRDIV